MIPDFSVWLHICWSFSFFILAIEENSCWCDTSPVALSPLRESCTFSRPFVLHAQVFTTHWHGYPPQHASQGLPVISLENHLCARKQLGYTRSLATFAHAFWVPLFHYMHRKILTLKQMAHTHTHLSICTNMHTQIKREIMCKQHEHACLMFLHPAHNFFCFYRSSGFRKKLREHKHTLCMVSGMLYVMLHVHTLI